MTFAKKVLAQKRILRERYSNVLNQVQNWNPPTSSHKNLKDFMIRQLQSSIEFDCNEKYYLKILEKPQQSADEWLSEMISSSKELIQYHTEQAIKDKKSHQDNIDWISALEQSVPMEIK